MTKARPRGRPKLDAEKRENEILIEAVNVFSKNGYRTTDLQKIADNLGIAKGTIYLYFKSKEKLFQTAVDYSTARLAERIEFEVLNTDSPLDRIKAIVRAHMLFFSEEYALAEIIARERGDFKDRAEKTYLRVFSENSVRIEDIIREGIKEGTFRKVNVKKATEILANLLTGTIYTYMFAKKNGNLDGAIDATTDILLNGLLNERNGI
jgi:AcrR family transcriptional regulator